MASASNAFSVTTLTLPQSSAQATPSAAPNSASLFQRAQGSNVFTLRHHEAIPNMPPLFLKLRVSSLEEEFGELAIASSGSAAVEEQKSDTETESFRPAVKAFSSIVQRIQGFLEAYRIENGWNESLDMQLWNWGFATQKGTLEIIEKGLRSIDHCINQDEIELFAEKCLQKVITILRNPYGGKNALLQDPVLDGAEVMDRVAHQQAFLTCHGIFPNTDRLMTMEPRSHAFAKEIIDLLKTQYELPATEIEAPIQRFLDTLPRIETPIEAQASSASAATATPYPQLDYGLLTDEQDSILREIAFSFDQTANKISSRRDLDPIYEAMIQGNAFTKTAIAELKRLSAETIAEIELSAQERDNAIEARIAESNEVHERTNRGLIEQLTQIEERFRFEMQQKQRVIEAQSAAHIETLTAVRTQVDELSAAQQQTMEALRIQTGNQIAGLEAEHRMAIRLLESRIAEERTSFHQSITQMQQQHASTMGVLNGRYSSLNSTANSLSSAVNAQSDTIRHQNQQLQNNRDQIVRLRGETDQAIQNADNAGSGGGGGGGGCVIS